MVTTLNETRSSIVQGSEVRVARPTSRVSLFASLVTATLLLAAPAAFSSSTGVHSKLAGDYRAIPSLPGAPGPAMDVSLGQDGSATIVEDTGTNAVTLFGHWVDSGSQVTVTFDAVEGQPAEPPMIFEQSHGGLQAATWDHALWGKTTPPLVKKGGAVKEMYWFDTVR